MKDWYSCDPAKARQILIWAYGEPRFLMMLFEYSQQPFNEHFDWTRWLMSLVLKQKRIDSMRGRMR